MVGQTAFFCEEGGGDTFVFLLTSISEADIFRRDQLWRVSCLVMLMLVSLSRALVQSPSSSGDQPTLLLLSVSASEHLQSALHPPHNSVFMKNINKELVFCYFS